MDPRIERLARLLVEYSVDVQPDQLVAIHGSAVASPLLLEIYRQVVRAGGHPVPVLNLPGADEILLKEGSDAQLQMITPFQRSAIEDVDVSIRIMSDENTRTLSSVDPQRQQVAQISRRDLMKTMLHRSASGDLEWVITLFPTNAYAQDADMSLADYTEFVYQAGHLNEEDPVSYWKSVSTELDRLIEWLSTKEHIHLTGPDTDLMLSVAGRTWIKADGKRNFPDGEIFTGPVETYVDGHVRFTFPSQVQGREVEDIRLWFEEGKVVKATAEKNQEYLDRMLDADEGARRLGEFAFGTNFGITQFTKNILFDEKIGGTVHMAIGAGYPESGSKNESAVHWDMICDLREGGQATADGEVFMKDGKIVV